jgi:DNA primase
MDYEGMNFGDAHEAVTGRKPDSSLARQKKQRTSNQSEQTQLPRYSLPSRKWLNQAEELVQEAHKVLMQYEPGLNYLQRRGFSLSFIKKWRFGWIRQDKYDHLQKWGIQGPENKKVWLPSGLLIPMWQNIGDCPFPDTIKLKIRRPEQERKKFNPAAKYWLVRGGYSGPVILSRYGDFRLPCVIVESELDGLLLLQDAGDLVNILCLGSATIRPDETVTKFLKQVPKIFLSFDFDQAGGSSAKWWLRNFRNGMLWLPDENVKDVGELKEKTGDIRTWVVAGLIKAGLIKLPEKESGQGQEAGVKAEPEARPDQKSRVEPEPESEVSLQGQQGQSSHQNKKRITKTISNSKQEQIKQLKEELYRILPRLKGHVDFVQKRLWFDLPGISNKDVEQWELFGKAESLFWAILELQAG